MNLVFTHAAIDVRNLCQGTIRETQLTHHQPVPTVATEASIC
jgi:hypothetical protein